MQDTRYDFQPMRVDHGDETNILVGCSGELLRIDSDGTPMYEPVTPFPANVSDGVVIGESWIGTWVDPDENVFFHMGDLKTKTLEAEAGSALEMIVKSFELKY